MSDDFNIDDIKLVKRTAPASPGSSSHDQASIPRQEIGEELEVTLTRRQFTPAPPAPAVEQKTVPPPAPPVKPPPAPSPAPPVKPPPAPSPAPAVKPPPAPSSVDAVPPPPEIKIPEKKAPQINIPANTQLKRPDAIEKKGNDNPVFDVPEMDITVKAAPPPPPPPVHGKAVPPKPAKGKSLLPGERTAPTAGKPKTSEFQARNYGRGCCIFAFVVPLIFGAGIAATIRYWKPLRSQLAKFEAWMVDKGLAFDGGDAPWKHQSENEKLPPETNSDSQ